LIGCIGGVIRTMKNIQFSSRRTDEKAIVAFLCAVTPAFIGFSIQPPALAFEHLRLFDAALSSLLGIAFWGAYHCFGFDRFVGKKAVTTIIAAVVLWGLAVAGLMAALHRVDVGYSPELNDLTTRIL